MHIHFLTSMGIFRTEERSEKMKALGKKPPFTWAKHMENTVDNANARHYRKSLFELADWCEMKCNDEHGLDTNDDEKYWIAKQARISAGEKK